jgi:hypothetical protein
VLFYGLRGLCVGHVINLIDFVVRRLAESVSISGAILISGADSIKWIFGGLKYDFLFKTV